MRILTNNRTSPWDTDLESIQEVKDQAKPTYNGIKANSNPYTDRRKLDYGPIQEVRSNRL